MRQITLVILILIAASSASAQSQADLPRRGYFGVGLEKRDEGVRVFSVAEGSTAAGSGIVIGDFIESIDGSAATSPEGVVATLVREAEWVLRGLGLV